MNLKPDSLKFENTRLAQWWTYWKKKATGLPFDLKLQLTSKHAVSYYSINNSLLELIYQDKTAQYGPHCSNYTTADGKADNFGLGFGFSVS